MPCEYMVVWCGTVSDEPLQKNFVCVYDTRISSTHVHASRQPRLTFSGYWPFFHTNFKDRKSTAFFPRIILKGALMNALTRLILEMRGMAEVQMIMASIPARPGGTPFSVSSSSSVTSHTTIRSKPVSGTALRKLFPLASDLTKALGSNFGFSSRAWNTSRPVLPLAPVTKTLDGIADERAATTLCRAAPMNKNTKILIFKKVTVRRSKRRRR